MPVQFYIIISFFIFLFTIAILARNSTMEKLPIYPGEKILFEEKNILLKQKGMHHQVSLPNCVVRVTNHRIIIAQKILLKKNSHALRHVIIYENYKKQFGLLSSIKKGYLTFELKKSQLKLSNESKKDIVKIALPESSLTNGQYLQYPTNNIDQYKNLFS